MNKLLGILLRIFCFTVGVFVIVLHLLIYDGISFRFFIAKNILHYFILECLLSCLNQMEHFNNIMIGVFIGNSIGYLYQIYLSRNEQKK